MRYAHIWYGLDVGCHCLGVLVLVLVGGAENRKETLVWQRGTRCWLYPQYGYASAKKRDKFRAVLALVVLYLFSVFVQYTEASRTSVFNGLSSFGRGWCGRCGAWWEQKQDLETIGSLEHQPHRSAVLAVQTARSVLLAYRTFYFYFWL